MPLVLVVGALLISPSGILLLPIQAAPEMVIFYLLAALTAVLLTRRRRRLSPADAKAW
jgi:membrane protein implicated in regulation of membrane protease activity